VSEAARPWNWNEPRAQPFAIRDVRFRPPNKINGELPMTFASKTLLAACAAAAIPVMAGSAGAAPLSQSLDLKNANVGVVQDVQFRRRGWRHGRWIGPAAGFAAGVAVGSALAPRYYDYGYDSYAYAPGVRYAPQAYAYDDYAYSPGFRSRYPAARCGDADSASAYPSWACPANPRATGW
jgi:hypothetical protein